MSNVGSRCPHVATIGSISKDDYLNAIQKDKCLKCDLNGPHLWLCLREECLFVGCGSGKEKNDHSSDHEKEKAHPLQFNLTTKRIWCYSCAQEVYLNNDPPFEVFFLDRCLTPPVRSSEVINEYHQSIANSLQVNLINVHQENISSPSTRNLRHQEEKSFEPIFFEYEHAESNQNRGISGLYNLGNTCYMNSALQALSHCVPLTSYFLDFSSLILTNNYFRPRPINSHLKSNGKLAKSYLKLIQSMWKKNSDGRQTQVMNPSSVASEIRSINPSFRTFTQQDAQEFLRCFMDELHSEMRFVQLENDEKQRSESESSDQSQLTSPISIGILRQRIHTVR